MTSAMIWLSRNEWGECFNGKGEVNNLILIYFTKNLKASNLLGAIMHGSWSGTSLDHFGLFGEKGNCHEYQLFLPKDVLESGKGILFRRRISLLCKSFNYNVPRILM